jgi:glucose-6-phosphate dehydrogenase assembly protein OpcA
VIVNLENTTSAKISSALVKARRTAGSPTMGMVLTLIIVAEEKEYADALQSSMEAGREHPSRILLVVTNSSRKPALDAEVRIGEGTPGEVIVVRMSGAIAAHPASVIRPLLLPDSPVVIWWPGRCPVNPTNDELAQLAGRRLTDAANTPRPMHALTIRAENYLPGDTDLAWTRLTPWRALLAAALDQAPYEPITEALVSGLRDEPALDILAGWLAACIDGPVTRAVGDLKVVLTRPTETITLSRPQTGVTASLTRTGRPEARIPLARREARDCLAEEMRRLDADEIYHRALVGLNKVVYV